MKKTICFTNIQTFETLFQGEINKVLHDSGVEDRHLVAGFKTALVVGGRLERVGSVIPLANHQMP